MIIVPSVLEKTPEEYIKTLKKLSPYFNHFQIDIADGRFVPNRTAQIEDIIPLIINDQSSMINNLTYDFHLMVNDYQTEVNKLVEYKDKMKIKNLLIHASVNPNFQSLIFNFPFFSFGLVLNPDDSINTISQKYDLKTVQSLQIMSVVPGKQGQPFIPETMQKIEQLRLLGYRNKILIDGAVNETTIPMIVSLKYKPDILCPGSYLAKTDRLLERVKYLNGLSS